MGSNAASTRYRRHFVLPHVCLAGQERLAGAEIVAEDELCALYLGAAGVGCVVVPTVIIAERVRAQNPTILVRVDTSVVPLGRTALQSAHAALAKLRQLLTGDLPSS